MAPPALIEARIISLLNDSEGLTVKEIVAKYNTIHGTKYERNLFTTRLNRLVKERKLSRFKDEYAEVGQRYFKYFVNGEC